MADSLNIRDLPKIDEIKSGDFVLVETPNGTKILDFRNFLISEDNITFAARISSFEVQNIIALTRTAMVTAAIFAGNQDLITKSLSTTSVISGAGFSINGNLFTFDSANNVFTFSNKISAKGAYGTSDIWGSAYVLGRALSGYWTTASSTVSTVSSKWNSAYSTVNANSATWGGGSTKWTEPGGSVTYLTQTANSLGIGVTLPNEKLTVSGNVSAKGVVYSQTSDSNRWSSVHSTVAANSADWGTLIAGGWADDGAVVRLATISDMVGIGTTSTNGNKLAIVGAVSATGNIRSASDIIAAGVGTFTGTISSGSVMYASAGNSNNWNSVYTSTSPNSSKWESTFSTLSSNSANWTSGYNSKINSAAFNVGNGTITLTKQDITTVTVNTDGRYPTYTSTPANANRITRWSGAGSLSASSVLYELSGNKIGVNTITPNEALTVVGAISASGALYSDTVNTNVAYFKNSFGSSGALPAAASNNGMFARTSDTNSAFFAAGSNWLRLASYDSTGVLSLSGNLNTAYLVDGRDVSTDGLKLDNTYTSIRPNSAGWASAETTVRAYSAVWGGIGVTGSGSVNYLTKWTDLTVAGSSTEIYETGNRIGIGTTVPTQKLTVGGHIATTGNVYTSGGELFSVDPTKVNSNYSTVNTNSALWSSSYTTTRNNSGGWQSVYATVNATSGDWEISAGVLGNSSYTTLNANSASWSIAYTNVNANSAKRDSVYSSVNATSGTWDTSAVKSTTLYTTVNANSSEWNKATTVYSTVKSNSAKWDSVYSSVNTNSSLWVNAFQTIQSTAPNWNATHTSYAVNSSRWNTADTHITRLNVISGKWDSSYTTSNTYSAIWNTAYSNTVDLFNHVAYVRSLSSDWNLSRTTYNTVLPNSGNWNSVYSSTSPASSKWDSTHTTLSANSAKWDSVYTSANSNSANWDSAYTYTSTKGESVYSTANSNSAKWSSAYTTVNSNSATWSLSVRDVDTVPTVNNITSIVVSNGTLTDDGNGQVTIDVANGARSFDKVDIDDADSGFTWGTAELSATLSNQRLKLVQGTGVSLHTDITGRAIRLSVPTTANASSVYTAVNSNSSNWDSAYTFTSTKGTSVYSSVNSTSGSWNSVYTNVNSNSGEWDTAYTTLTANSGEWDTAYTTITANSGRWGTAYTTITANSGRWDTAYTTITANSANWNTAYGKSVPVYSTVNSNSSNWDSVYSSTSTTSGLWNSARTTLLGNSGRWESVYSTTGSNSSKWGSVYSSVNSNSSNWDSAYTFTSTKGNSVYSTVNTNSGGWSSLYTGINSNSGNWDSVYSSTSNTSGLWNSGYTLLGDNSGRWVTVYTSTNNNSANWNSTYSTVNSNSATWNSVNVAAGTHGKIQFNNLGFFGSTTLFHWDNTNKRLGIGTVTPRQQLDVANNAIISETLSAKQIYVLSTSASLIDSHQLSIRSAATLTLTAFRIAIPSPVNITGGLTAVNVNLNNREYARDAILIDNVYSTVNTNSSEWEGTYATVNSNSALWVSTGRVNEGQMGKFAYYPATTAVVDDTDVFHWDNVNKRVGLGTSTPTNDIHIKKSASGNVSMLVENTSLAPYATAAYFVKTANTTYTLESDRTSNFRIKNIENNNTAITVTTAGNVGIGNLQSSIAKLTVSGSIQGNADLYIDGNTRLNGTTQILGSLSAAANVYVVGSAFDANNVSRITLTSTPSAAIRTAGNLVFEVDHYNVGAYSDIIFNTDGSTRLRIGAPGDVTVTQTAQDRALTISVSGQNGIEICPNQTANAYINGAGSGDAIFKVSDRAINFASISNSGAGINLWTGTQAGYGKRVVVTTDGYVGIGTAAPEQLLHINGNALAVEWRTPSDLRLKKNVSTITNALNRVVALRGVTYQWKDNCAIYDSVCECGEDGRYEAGVIAQEVINVCPELVTTMKHNDETMYTLDYGRMAGFFIEAIKQLKSEIDTLKSQINK